MEDLLALIGRARGGDLQAFCGIVHRFQAMAIGHAYAQLGDLHLSEDAVQEAFLQAYLNLADLQEAEAFPAWLCKIVRSQCRRITRKKQVPTTPLENAAAVAADDCDPIAVLERRERQERIYAALKRLPADERRVLALFYTGSYSHGDIAALLDITRDVVNHRLRSARKRLRRQMSVGREVGLYTNTHHSSFLKETITMINLDSFSSPYFKDVIVQHVQAYQDRFKDRLAAMYVRGSVFRDEAVEGISDLDFFIFTTDELTPADRQWVREARQNWKAEHGTSGVGFVPARSIAVLHQRPFLKRYLRYDSALVWGRDLIAGENIPPLVVGISSEWRLARYAAGLEKENTTDFRLPAEPPLKLRKFARMAVLVGASYLMHRGESHTFKGTEILPRLQRQLPQWSQFLDTTTKLYIHPTVPSTQQLESYLHQLLDWMVWVAGETGEGEYVNELRSA
ncbi:MAG: sigma-70 family RNA polymerase sigma factor [Candidatus Latescibacteria bacterium]|nr:sigma-70 family RNA polymerase sigma factor [Candidatus Latescibacterota bacterium]